LKIYDWATLRIRHRQSWIFDSSLPRTPWRLGWALLMACALIVGCARRPAPPAPYVAFVVCQASRNVSVVNLAELRVVASLPVSLHPEAAVLRPGGREIFVTGSGGIDRIQIPDLRVRPISRTDYHPRSLVFSPDGRIAYFLLEGEPQTVPEGALAGPPRIGVSHFAAWDCESEQELGQMGARAQFSRLAITPDGKTLLASDPVAGKLHFFDALSRRPLGIVDLAKGAKAIAIQPFGSKAFVSDTEEAKISVIDTATRQLLSHIELGMRPGPLLLKPDGGELFVLSPEASTLAIVDAFHDNVSQTLTAGRTPVAGVFRKDSRAFYLSNAGDGSVMALDVRNRTLLATTHVGGEPRALALTPDERFLVVADTVNSSLAILIADPARLAGIRSPLVTTVPVGTRPVDVAIPDWQWKEVKSR
jgi:DNA-binding beta-propeller fold protein YncE